MNALLLVGAALAGLMLMGRGKAMSADQQRYFDLAVSDLKSPVGTMTASQANALIGEYREGGFGSQASVLEALVPARVAREASHAKMNAERPDLYRQLLQAWADLKSPNGQLTANQASALAGLFDGSGYPSEANEIRILIENKSRLSGF